jgi:hypothetical protein
VKIVNAAINQTDTRTHTKLTQVKVSVNPEIAAAFKKACSDANVSMAAELTRFMSDYANGAAKQKAATDCSTRRKRRALIKRSIAEFERIRAAEERMIDNAHENLREAPIYETAELYISILEDVIEQLGEIAS